MRYIKILKNFWNDIIKYFSRSWDDICKNCNHDRECHNTVSGHCATWLNYEMGYVCQCKVFRDESYR